MSSTDVISIKINRVLQHDMVELRARLPFRITVVRNLVIENAPEVSPESRERMKLYLIRLAGGESAGEMEVPSDSDGSTLRGRLRIRRAGRMIDVGERLTEAFPTFDLEHART